MNLNIFLQTAPLFRIFIMLMAGIISGEYIFTSVSPAVSLFAVIILLAALPLTKRSGTVQSAQLLFTVYITGLCSYRTAVVNMDIIERGYYDYHAVVTSTIKHNKDFSTFDIIKIGKDGNNLKIKATVKGDVALYPGDRLHIRSKINPPEDRKKGRFSYASLLKRSGYAGTTFINTDNISFAGNYNGDLSLWTRIKINVLQMRSDILAKIYDAGIRGRDFATVSAMAFGDKTYLTSTDREIYSRTGVSHVLALSGLHIGIIYTFLSFFMTFIPKVPRFIAIQAAIWFYVLFAGMSPSLVRAALMITVYSIGTLMHREKISINSLSLAGMVSLLLSPQTLFDLCFQLSFLSVFAILLFYRPLTNILPSRPLAIRKVTQMTAVSLAAYIGTMPLILYNFGNISICFIITNLFVIPLTTLVIYLSIISTIPLINTLSLDILSITVHLLNTLVNCIASISFVNIDNMYISMFTVLLMYVIIISIYLIYVKLHSEI